MTEVNLATKHDTLVLERTYQASPERVFAAWSEPAIHKVWDAPGEGWELAELEMDFRIGGRDYSRFGPPGDPRYWSEGVYLDILPGRRIVSAGTMHDGGLRIAVTLGTIELFPEEGGTRLRLTDQSAFLEGREDASDRKSGYGAALDKLEAFLAGDQPGRFKEGSL